MSEAPQRTSTPDVAVRRSIRKAEDMFNFGVPSFTVKETIARAAERFSANLNAAMDAVVGKGNKRPNMMMPSDEWRSDTKKLAIALGNSDIATALLAVHDNYFAVRKMNPDLADEDTKKAALVYMNLVAYGVNAGNTFRYPN